MLCLTRPDVIRGMHAAFFDVGVDAVETASFGSFSTVLNEYDVADKAYELNVAAARLAREVADDFSADGRTRYVAGSVGPGTKLPSLGHIGFAELRDSYEEQAAGLLEGGVDLFLIETCMDLLQVKAAMIACRRAMKAAGRTVPLQVQVTMETTGRMLVGSEIGAALVSLGGDATRRARHQLRHRPRRDAGAPALPVATLAAADQRAAQRRTPERRRRTHPLRPHARGARRVPPAPRHRARRVDRRWLLRHHAGAPPPGRRGGRRRPTGPSLALVRAERVVDLQPGHPRSGPQRADDRRAHQRQRLEGVPRRDARRRLGHVREDGQRADQGGRPRPRRLRRLRRPRRHRRHGRDRQALRHPVERPARHRLHRAAGGGGGAHPHRRAGDPQLGQPRGRRAPGQPDGPRVLARPRLRGGGDLPAHRRARPGPRRRVEDGGRPPHHRDRHRALRAAAE